MSLFKDEQTEYGIKQLPTGVCHESKAAVQKNLSMCSLKT